MKKKRNSNKAISIMIFLMMILSFATNNVYAETTKYVQEVVVSDFEEVDPLVKTVVGSAWSTISLVVQVLAVLCIIITGLRYMMASTDKKADIKTGSINIASGCVLVFAAVPLIQVIVSIFKDIILL